MVKPVNNSNIITLNKCNRVTVEDPELHSIRVAFAEVQVEEVANKPGSSPSFSSLSPYLLILEIWLCLSSTILLACFFLELMILLEPTPLL
jgi:hypothetical protein